MSHPNQTAPNHGNLIEEGPNASAEQMERWLGGWVRFADQCNATLEGKFFGSPDGDFMVVEDKAGRQHPGVHTGRQANGESDAMRLVKILTDHESATGDGRTPSKYLGTNFLVTEPIQPGKGFVSFAIVQWQVGGKDTRSSRTDGSPLVTTLSVPSQHAEGFMKAIQTYPDLAPIIYEGSVAPYIPVPKAPELQRGPWAPNFRPNEPEIVCRTTATQLVVVPPNLLRRALAVSSHAKQYQALMDRKQLQPFVYPYAQPHGGERRAVEDMPPNYIPLTYVP